jgi:hypothetical protein
VFSFLFLLFVLSAPSVRAATNVSGAIAADTVWALSGSPYVVVGNVTVQGTDGADGITTLTIEPGAQVRFNGTYSGLTIGGSTGASGALMAQGTVENPILFTSHKTVPAAGDWGKIQFANTSDDATSVMNHCVVEYGGNPGAIYLLNASPAIQNSTIRHGRYAAIYIAGSGSGTAVIRCNTFTLNARGIYSSAKPAPQLAQNNFIANSTHGIYHTGGGILTAENNWWNSVHGPNTGGDITYGNVDTNPWSPAQNQCNELAPNLPPNPPAAPSPADNAVRVTATNGVKLVWTCTDPNVLDTLRYDLFWGTAADALTPLASDLASNTYTQSGASLGTTYYWKVVAKDDKGAATAGPVWHFTTTGDSPDLIVSGLSTEPAGHIQTGQNVTLTATVQNIGTGPVVDAFAVEFKLDGTIIATPAIGDVLLAGQSQIASTSFICNSGDPSISVKADSASTVNETNEKNNQFIAQLSAVADNTPPTMTSSSPTDGAFLQQIQQISATLVDSQSAINMPAVASGFAVTNSAQNPISGTVQSTGNTFTFVPITLPLADDTYKAHLTATDIHGNTRPFSFSFTIDTAPPAKPVITGGTVASGVIQARPVQNTADQFIVKLTGTRDADTSVWIGNARHVTVGSAAWSSPLTLEPDSNAFEVWLVDRAGNRGASEWVDIAISTGSGIIYEYNAAGRLKRVSQSEEVNPPCFIMQSRMF